MPVVDPAAGDGRPKRVLIPLDAEEALRALTTYRRSQEHRGERSVSPRESAD